VPGVTVSSVTEDDDSAAYACHIEAMVQWTRSIVPEVCVLKKIEISALYLKRIKNNSN
jgi:hypothetical protein